VVGGAAERGAAASTRPAAPRTGQVIPPEGGARPPAPTAPEDPDVRLERRVVTVCAPSPGRPGSRIEDRPCTRPPPPPRPTRPARPYRPRSTAATTGGPRAA